MPYCRSRAPAFCHAARHKPDLTPYGLYALLRAMNGKQLRRFLDDSGMTQVGAARLLGLNDRTMRRYVKSREAIPRIVEYALRWLASRQPLGQVRIVVAGARAAIQEVASGRAAAKHK